MRNPIKTLTIQSDHLHFPIRNGNPKIRLQIKQGERLTRELEAEIATSEPVDWWAFYDVGQLKGQTVSLVAPNQDLSDDQAAWLAKAIQNSDGVIGAGDLYHEKYRPQFHFTPRRGWNNDPNGMVYHQGEWHLYYQYNPFGTSAGNIHWGHAASRDLLAWQELPAVLYQKSLADVPWSGGGAVDRTNAAGFKSGGEDPIVVTFASTGRGECLAYSLDRGRTFQEYPGNPIIPHSGRDPKPVWYEPAKKWSLIVYEEPAHPGAGPGTDGKVGPIGYALYDSPDLKHWTRQDFLPGWYECPDLFELPVANRPGVRHWVIYGNAYGKYKSAFTAGSFDGTKFTPLIDPTQAHFGPHFYAAQTFSHAPGGRCIMMGWLAGAAYPEMPFSQGMTVPLELSLRETPLGLRLCFYPVEELAGLRTSQVSGSQLDLRAANRLLETAPGELFDIELAIRPESQVPVSLKVGDWPVSYDPAAQTLAFAGETARVSPPGDSLALRVLVDRSVTEVFANDGEAAFSAMTLFPTRRPEIVLQGNARVESLAIHSLRSIWG